MSPARPSLISSELLPPRLVHEGVVNYAWPTRSSNWAEPLSLKPVKPTSIQAHRVTAALLRVTHAAAQGNARIAQITCRVMCR
jgi:hypothetical protein